MEEGPAPSQGFGVTGTDRTSAELNPGGPKRCPGARDWACMGRGTLRRRCSLRSATAAKRTERGAWLGDGGGAEAEPGQRPGLRRLSVMTP